MNLDGTYRGFAPTDESGVVVGELELIIDGHSVSYRHATGLEVQSDSDDNVAIRELPADEIASFFQDGADIHDVSGYEIGVDGPVMLFLSELPDEPDIPGIALLRLFGDEIDGIFGPSSLWRPDQVAAGAYERSVAAIETEQGDPGVIPRLDNDGRRLEPSDTVM